MMQEGVLTSFALYDLYVTQTWLTKNKWHQKLGQA